MDVDFVEPQQYKNGAFIIPATLDDLYLYRQVTKVFVFMGFPYDVKDPERVGSEKASSKIRDALTNLPYYDLSTSLSKGDICFLDLGDMKQDHSEGEALKVLYCWAAETLNQLPQSKLIIVGGLRDQTTQSLQSLVDGLDYNQEVQIVHIDNELSNINIFTNEAFLKTKSEILFFGVSGASINHKTKETLEDQGAKILFMDRDIRRKARPNTSFCITQAGQALEQAIDAKETPIVLTIHCEAINSAYCPGQSTPNVIGGITNSELTDIISICAKRIRILNICGFNPAVESNRSSKLLATLIYDYIGQI